MKAALTRFWRDEDGATAIEYGFIASIVGLGIVGSLQLIAPAFNLRMINLTTYF